MKKRKIVAFTLATGLLLSTCGCGLDLRTGEKILPIEVTEEIGPNYDAYKGTHEMNIAAFWSPRLTEEQYRWASEAGFNQMYIDSKYSVTIGSERMYTALKYCEQFGMDAFIQGGNNWESDTNDYTDYPAFAGYGYDEPRPEYLQELGEIAERFNQKYPDKMFFVNLLPDASSIYGQAGAQNYDEYLEDYVSLIMNKLNLKQICVDVYPLTAGGGMREGWLKTIEKVANVAKRENVMFQSYIATMSIHRGSTRRPNESEIRYQAYTNMAYGAKGIHAFAYKSPGGPPYGGEFGPEDYAMIGEDDERTEIYYDAQKVFLEIKEWDHVFLQYDWDGVLMNYGSEEELSGSNLVFDNTSQTLQKYDGISDIETTRDTLIGCFKNEKNQTNGYMLVNFTNPWNDGTDKTNTVSMTFEGAEYAIVYANGNKKVLKLTQGFYKDNIPVGGANFVIPVSID